MYYNFDLLLLCCTAIKKIDTKSTVKHIAFVDKPY